MTQRKDLTPSQVVTEVLSALAEQRWNDLAQYVDPLELRELLDAELQSARRFTEPRITTAAEHQQHRPELPGAVAQWYEDEQRKYAHTATDELQRHFGVADLGEFERLSAAEQFGRLIRARDLNSMVRFEADRVHSNLKTFLPEMNVQQHWEVIGELVQDNLARVVCTRSDSRTDASVVTLKRSAAGWFVRARNSLFRDDGWFTVFDVHAADTVPRPPGLAISQLRWTARTFDHKLPPEMFPDLLERFRGTPARVSELVQSAPARTLTAKPNGKWSIQEHLGHLFDLEELGEQRLGEYQSKAAVLTAADMSNRKTEEANHNEAPLWELVERFREARAALVQKLEALPGDVIAHAAQHPRLQRPLNVVEWIYFMCEHDDHHLAAMRAQMTVLTQELWDEVFGQTSGH